MSTSKTKPQGDKLQGTDDQGPQVEVAPASGGRDGPATGGEVQTGTPPDAETQIAELKARIDSLEDSLLRAKADFQNLQRRAAAERADAIRYANADLLRSLLNVLDDFDRSLEAAEVSDNKEAVIDGVRLVHDNLMKA